jgi:hypothetical protein
LILYSDFYRRKKRYMDIVIPDLLVCVSKTAGGLKSHTILWSGFLPAGKVSAKKKRWRGLTKSAGME